MERGIILAQSRPPANSIILPLPAESRRPKNLHPCSHHLLCSYKYTAVTTAAARRKWDSNAETVRTRGFRFNEKDVDESQENEEEEEGNSGNWGKNRRRWSDNIPELNDSFEFFNDAIESVWILKVFKSFGWILPFIIFTLLQTSGPKAFLMALALPLGQSALSFAFEKLRGGTQSRPKRKSRMRRKASASTVRNAEMEVEEQEESRETRKGKMGYQSWEVGDNGSVNNFGKDAPSFGGWDELDRMRSMREPSRRKGGSQRTPVEKGKLSRKGRKSDTPLLLRLLIAVFPFLGSWTKMLL